MHRVKNLRLKAVFGAGFVLVSLVAVLILSVATGGSDSNQRQLGQVDPQPEAAIAQLAAVPPPPSCPSGYTLTSGECRKVVSGDLTTTCPTGYTLYSGQCTKTETHTPTCSTGYSLVTATNPNAKAQCRKIYDAVWSGPPQHGGYDCPDGGSLVGTKCFLYATPNCRTGYSLSRNTCTRTLRTTPTYTCNQGELIGTSCYLVTDPQTAQEDCEDNSTAPNSPHIWIGSSCRTTAQAVSYCNTTFHSTFNTSGVCNTGNSSCVSGYEWTGPSNNGGCTVITQTAQEDCEDNSTAPNSPHIWIGSSCRTTAQAVSYCNTTFHSTFNTSGVCNTGSSSCVSGYEWTGPSNNGGCTVITQTAQEDCEDNSNGGPNATQGPHLVRWGMPGLLTQADSYCSTHLPRYLQFRQWRL